MNSINISPFLVKKYHAKDQDVSFIFDKVQPFVSEAFRKQVTLADISNAEVSDSASYMCEILAEIPNYIEQSKC